MPILTLSQQAVVKITGFEGFIIGRCEYLTGCTQYGLTTKCKDSQAQSTPWFDEGLLTVTGVSVESVAGPENFNAEVGQHRSPGLF